MTQHQRLTFIDNGLGKLPHHATKLDADDFIKSLSNWLAYGYRAAITVMATADESLMVAYYGSADERWITYYV